MTDMYCKVIPTKPATVEMRLSQRQCDWCGNTTSNCPHPDHVNWAKEPGVVDHVTVRRVRGTVNSNRSNIETLEFHLCGFCFEALVADHLRDQGINAVSPVVPKNDEG
jgi:hypothetical protein